MTKLAIQIVRCMCLIIFMSLVNLLHLLSSIKIHLLTLLLGLDFYIDLQYRLLENESLPSLKDVLLQRKGFCPDPLNLIYSDSSAKVLSFLYPHPSCNRYPMSSHPFPFFSSCTQLGQIVRPACIFHPFCLICFTKTDFVFVGCCSHQLHLSHQIVCSFVILIFLTHFLQYIRSGFYLNIILRYEDTPTTKFTNPWFRTRASIFKSD